MVHITITEIITSTLLYTIVHGILWLGRNAERVMKRLLVTEVNHITHQHAKEKHQSTLRDCSENRCGELIASITTDLAI